MKKIIFILILSLCVLFSLTFRSFASDDWTGNINLLIGKEGSYRYHLDKSITHRETGVVVDFERRFSPIAFTMAFIRSTGEMLLRDEFYWHDVMDFKMDVTTYGLGAGLKYIIKPRATMHPYLAVDLAWIYSDGEATHPNNRNVRVKDSSQDIGAWISGGFYWTINDHFNLGLDLTYSVKKITLLSYNLNYYDGYASILLGYHW